MAPARSFSVGVELSGAGLRIAVLSMRPVPAIVHCEELVVQPGDDSHVGSMVARVLEKFGARRADVHLVFSPPTPAPGRHYLFTAPKLSKSELLAVASRELKRDGTVDPGNAYFAVDSVEDAEMEGGAKGQRYLLVALAKEPVDIAASSLLDAKIVLRSATTSAMGILQASYLTDLPSTGIVALAQLDIRRSTLMVLENGTPRFFRDIPTSFAKGGRDGTDDALVAQALARELDISLVFFAQQFRPKQVETVMIVGDAEVADRVSEWMEENQTYKVVRFAPNEKLKAEGNAPENLLPYAPAIGAALGTAKGRFAADILPSNLRGRPERLIATLVFGVTVILLVAVVMQMRSHAVRRTDENQVRLNAAKSQFEDMKAKIEKSAALEQQAARSDVWKAYFENTDLFTKKLGRCLFNLQRLVPPRVGLKEVLMTNVAGNLAPQPGRKPADMHMKVQGIAHAQDLQSAQTDVLNVYRASETFCPEVLQTALSPLNPVPKTNQEFAQTFTIDVDLLMRGSK